MRKLPIYKAIVNDDDETGIDAIALVTDAAVQHDFLCFAENKQKYHFDDGKHIITGVVCLADTPIYRFDGMNEYYIVFERDMVQKMVEKFMRNNLGASVNLQHDDNQKVEGIFLFESYIKDSTRGIVPNEFKDVPDGSWLCSYKVDNVELWHQIINGEVLNGFSLQGLFEQQLQFESQEKPEQQLDLVDEILNNL